MDEREGWFPKSYIEYVDAEQEKRRRQEGMFLHQYMQHHAEVLEHN